MTKPASALLHLSSLRLTKEAFADRGLPATFVTDLQAKITAFRAATDVKNTGKANRTAGIAGLDAAAAAGMRDFRTLRPLIRAHFKSRPHSSPLGISPPAWSALRGVQGPVVQGVAPAAEEALRRRW